MDQETIIKKLKRDGYAPVNIWREGPNEIDTDHTHPFDTYLVVLSGSIAIGICGETFTLESGDELLIPRNAIHTAHTGSEGCEYIVAEKH